ncbi:MAG: flippase [Candidatus Kryptoniota bacterium]
MRIVKTLLQNMALSFFAKAVYQLSNALLFLLIARLRGPEESGIYTLSVKYSLLFLTLGGWGFDSLIIWQASAHRSLTSRYFVNYSILRLLLCCAAYIGLAFVVNCVAAYNVHTTRVVLLVGIGLIPEGINRLVQAFLMAHGQFVYPTTVSLVVGLIRCVLGGLAIFIGGGLEVIASVYAASPLVGLGMYGVFLFQRHSELHISGSGKSKIKFDWDFMLRQVKVATPFALAEIFYAIDGQIDAIILAMYLSQEHLGFYGAAQNIIMPLNFAFYAYDMALYPWISRLYTSEQSRLWALYRRLLFYTALILLPMLVLVSGLAQPLIGWVYTNRFAFAATVVPWLVLSIVIQIFNEPNSRLIVVAGYSKVVTAILWISMVTNVLLNFLLVPRLGILGSAGARLFSTLMFAGLSGIFVFYRITPINPLPIISKPIVATIAFGIVFYLLSPFAKGLGLLIGGICYMCTLILTRVISIQVFAGLGKWLMYCGKSIIHPKG